MPPQLLVQIINNARDISSSITGVFFSWVTHNKTDTKIVVQFHKRASASGPSPDTLLCRPNSRLLSPALSIVTGDNGDEKDIKVAAVHTAKGCSRMTSFWLTLDIPCTSQ